ncbi:hypothetical protein PAMP_017744 [Pampus punctatissimus]
MSQRKRSFTFGAYGGLSALIRQLHSGEKENTIRYLSRTKQERDKDLNYVQMTPALPESASAPKTTSCLFLPLKGYGYGSRLAFHPRFGAPRRKRGVKGSLLLSATESPLPNATMDALPVLKPSADPADAQSVYEPVPLLSAANPADAQPVPDCNLFQFPSCRVSPLTPSLFLSRQPPLPMLSLFQFLSH